MVYKHHLLNQVNDLKSAVMLWVRFQNGTAAPLDHDITTTPTRLTATSE
jgi:hypothetical protein